MVYHKSYWFLFFIGHEVHMLHIVDECSTDLLLDYFLLACGVLEKCIPWDSVETLRPSDM